MSNKEKTLTFIMLLFIVINILELVVIVNSNYGKLFNSNNICFVMYTETCNRCGYDQVESEYSIVSNYGISSCKKCNSYVEFRIDDKGKKIVENNKK